MGWQVSPFPFELCKADFAISVTACLAFWRELAFKAAAVWAAIQAGAFSQGKKPMNDPEPAKSSMRGIAGGRATAAMNAARTECRRGHPLTPGNT
jgi:hypothetical protein